MKPTDVFICIREWIPLVNQIPTKKKFLWTGDAPDLVNSFGIGDKRVAEVLDGLMTVSEWHSKVMSEASGFPLEKCFAIKNGIHLPYFDGDEPRGRKRLIYSSAPFRGLEHLPRLFPRIREKHSDAELHVFSGFKFYEGKKPYEPAIQEQYRPAVKALGEIPGVTLHGNVLQKELAREFMKSSILCYPNIFEETSCITIMEAQAAGCVVVTSKNGALPETVGEHGVIIDGMPGEGDYDDRFVGAICELLDDDSKWNAISDAGKNYAQQELSWEKRAERFVEYLKSVHGLN